MSELTPEKVALIARNQRRRKINSAIKSAVDKGWRVDRIRPVGWIVDGELFFRCSLPKNGHRILHFNWWFDTIRGMMKYLTDEELAMLVMERPTEGGSIPA